MLCSFILVSISTFAFIPCKHDVSTSYFTTGLELTFYSGVYGTSIGSFVSFFLSDVFLSWCHELTHFISKNFCHVEGNTLHFSESKRLIGLCGVFIGVGEILGNVYICQESHL